MQKIEMQSRVFKLTTQKYSTKENPPSARRGIIRFFSPKSRKRLIDFINRIRMPKKCVFITVTYGQKWPDEKTSKKHIKQFMRVIKQIFPKSSGIWRLELQARGAPHYHLICFNVGWWPAADMGQEWAAIIGDEYCNNARGYPIPPNTDIRLIQNHRKAVHYVSKYVAKNDKRRPTDAQEQRERDVENHNNIARRNDLRARAAELEVDPKAESSNFTNLPYQNTDFFEKPGRFWGYFGKEDLPMGVLFEMFVSHEWVYLSLRRKATSESQHMRKIKRHQGFTLYTDKALQYFNSALNLEGGKWTR